MTVAQPLSPKKFQDPFFTADGSQRASVSMDTLRTLWINTGTLCNLTCRNCYIESSPKNDRLTYITSVEVAAYLDEIQRGSFGTQEIGFTGGEPFMNPDFPAMLEDALKRGFKVMVLTNAMKPMMKAARALQFIGKTFCDRLTIRVSLDHYTKEGHEAERGDQSWESTIEGLHWLTQHGFRINIAGRMFMGESENEARHGYKKLFARLGLNLNADDTIDLVLFPEMDATIDVPEITTHCWGKLGVDKNSVMCASSRMVVKRKDSATPSVVACTLLPYEDAFEFGPALQDAMNPVSLNHPHCAKFCVLGGAVCSQG